LKLVETLPNFSNEIKAALQAIDRDDLAQQIDIVEIDRYTFDSSCNALYIYLRPITSLNVVEANIIGVKHGETIFLGQECITNIEVDNFNRLSGIEVIDGEYLAIELGKHNTS